MWQHPPARLAKDLLGGCPLTPGQLKPACVPKPVGRFPGRQPLTPRLPPGFECVNSGVAAHQDGRIL
jgi:hypothetical protein